MPFVPEAKSEWAKGGCSGANPESLCPVSSGIPRPKGLFTLSTPNGDPYCPYGFDVDSTPYGFSDNSCAQAVKWKAAKIKNKFFFMVLDTGPRESKP